MHGRIISDMNNGESEATTIRKPLRLWPGVAIVIVQWLLWFVAPRIEPETGLVSVIGGVVGALAVFIWWLFFSRARWSDRLSAFVFMIVAVVATKLLVDKSIASGMMGMMFYIYVLPGVSLALVAGIAMAHRLSAGPRRMVMAAAILLACGVWLLLRTDGISNRGSQMAWRWTPTPEERLLAQDRSEPKAPPPATPGTRGS